MSKKGELTKDYSNLIETYFKLVLKFMTAETFLYDCNNLITKVKQMKISILLQNVNISFKVIMEPQILFILKLAR